MQKAACALACALVTAGCSSSASSPAGAGDSGGCDASCTADAGGVGPGSGDTGASDAPQGTGAPLCPGSGPIIGPLPTGISLVLSPSVGSALYGTPRLLATDSAVFLADQYSVRRVALSGGAVTTYLDHSMDQNATIGGFAMDAQNVYFSEAGQFGATSTLGLAKVPLSAAGSPVTVIANPNVGVIAVAGGYLYYESMDTTGTVGSSIDRVPVTGGTPTVLLRGVLGGLLGLSVGGGYAYFMSTIGVSSYSNLYVARVPITAVAPDVDGGLGDAGSDASADDGGPGAGIVPTGSEFVAMTGLDGSPPVTDATNVYWGDEDMLMAAPLTGGAPRMVAQAPQIGGFLPMTAVVQTILPLGGSVYWSSFGCQSIRKTPIAGGTGVDVVPMVSAYSLASNASHLYFTAGANQVLSGPL